MQTISAQYYRDKYNKAQTNLDRFNLIQSLFSLVNVEKREPTEQYYAVREKGTSRQKLNDRAIDLIAKFNAHPELKPTPAEKQELAKFSGFGGGLIDKTTGQKGSAYEYYTPKPIAEGVWDCLKSIGFNGGKVLDPSAGTGIFGATAPLSAAVDAVELSTLSGRVNQLVNDGPAYKTTISNYEAVASKTPDGIYDAVVTNVPFGDVSARGDNRFDDLRYQDEPLENYFILRTLEKLRPNGLAAFIVPMRCVSGRGGKPEDLRTRASYMAEFVGAYRLPSGTFSTASTDVATDVIFFRKFSKETAEKIAELREQNAAVLSEAKVQWETFIEGKYFESTEGKPYVLGEFVAKDPTKFRDVDKVISNSGLSDLREILRKRHLPKSRINWDLLETAETAPIVYNDGDVIYQAGCTLEMRNGVWVQLPKAEADKELAKIAENLTDPYKAFENKVSYQTALKYFDYSTLTGQVMNIPSWLTESISTLSKLPEKDRAKNWNKGIVALSVNQVLEEHSSDIGFNYKNEFVELSKALEDARISKKDSSIGGNIGTAMKVAVQQYFKKQFSNLWLGNVAKEVQKTADVAENINTPEQKLNKLVYQTKSQWLDIEQIKGVLGADFDPITASDWCISADGKKAIKADDYYVGNYAEFLQKIDEQIKNAPNETVKAKLLRQKNDAENRAPKLDVSRFIFDLRVADAIVTPEEKVSFLRSFVSPHAKVSVDDLGRPYADIDVPKSVKNTWHDRLYNRVGDYIKTGNLSLQGMKLTDKEDPSPELLDRMKDEALNELKAIVNRANENFNTWARTDKTIMARLRAMADNPKNRRFTSVEDETEVQIPGMNPNLHLHGYQSAYVRQMGREFGGINGFGVGLGKTFTALAAVQHVQAMGVKNKTIFVVPNSVLANWRKEASNAYSSIDDCLFIGLRFDKNGKPKTNSSAYAEDLSRIKENKHAKIFMTYEAFKRIRVKEETIEKFGEFMRSYDASFAISEAKKTDEKHKGRLGELLNAFNADKQSAFPYIEDLGIDSIVIDEAHAFKNSASAAEFKGGKYLSLTPASSRGLDAQLKTWYIRGSTPMKDGVLMLTATPITNSPLEVFSMLTLSVGLERVNESMIGCRGADDFLKETCIVSQEVGVQVDGMTKSMNIFTGLKNVDILRRAIGQTVSVKNAKDVGAKVFIPDRDVKNQKITLDPQSVQILQDYKLAYRYATEKLKAEEQKNFNEEMVQEPYKSAYERINGKFHEPMKLIAHPFNLIQKMSRAILDKELDDKATFYMIADTDSALELAEKVNDQFDALGLKEDRDRMSPWTKNQAVLKEKIVKDTDSGEEKSVLTIHVEADSEEGGAVLVNDQAVGNANSRNRVIVDSIENKAQTAYENLAEKNKLDLDVTCSPKIAAMLENFKNEMAHPRGMISENEKSHIVKQIIFCDELSLHNKIKRLLTTQCGISGGKIAIITGQTNNEPEQLQDVSDGFNAQGEENRYQVIIANEKAEVGINLQKGTQAIHHLTIGWTPDSIEQRNGRGARQGNRTQRVSIYFYDADGTFDEARREMVNRKSEWIGQVLDVNGGTSVDIKGGLSNEEQEALIEAIGDAEGTRKVQEMLAAKEKDARIARSRESQTINLDMLVKQKAFLDRYDSARTLVEENAEAAFSLKLELDKLVEKFAKEQEDAKKKNQTMSDSLKQKRESAIEKLRNSFDALIKKLNNSASYQTYYSRERITFDEVFNTFVNSYGSKTVAAFSKYVRSNIYIYPDENGEIYLAWKDAREQAESLIKQAVIAFKTQSKKEGTLSDEVLDKFEQGEGRIFGSNIVVKNAFYVTKNNLCLVSFGTDFYSKKEGLKLKWITNTGKEDSDLIGFDAVDFSKIVLPGSAAYEECLRSAAKLEDEAVNHGESTRIYSEAIPSVSQYRKQQSLVSYSRHYYKLPAPYFGYVVCPREAEASPFLKAIADSQKEIVKSSDSNDFNVSSDVEVIEEKWDTQQELKAFGDYATAHNLRPTLTELRDAYVDIEEFALPINELKEVLKTPVDGMTPTQQAAAWVKEKIAWVDFEEYSDDGIVKIYQLMEVVKEAEFLRENPENTLDSHKVDPDSTVYIRGKTLMWKGVIKRCAAEVGSYARWRKYEGAWVVSGATWNKMIDEKGRVIINDLNVRSF